MKGGGIERPKEREVGGGSRDTACRLAHLEDGGGGRSRDNPGK